MIGLTFDFLRKHCKRRKISSKNGKLISEESLFGTFWITTSHRHLIHNFYYLEMHSSAVIPSPHLPLCPQQLSSLLLCSKSRYWSNPKQSPWLFFTSVVTSQKLFFPWDYFVAKITIKWVGFTRLIQRLLLRSLWLIQGLHSRVSTICKILEILKSESISLKFWLKIFGKLVSDLL